MIELDWDEICAAYGWETAEASKQQISSGLINTTCKLRINKVNYILQSINNQIFDNPLNIDFNINYIANYLRLTHPEYSFIAPLANLKGDTLTQIEDRYYRVFNFVDNSKTITTVENAQQAFEAARQFGHLTANCKGLDINQLKVTLPNFHDLPLRYLQFTTALQNGNSDRIIKAADLIETVEMHQSIVTQYKTYIQHPEVQLRVTHHDTKISNIIFDNTNKALFVIDLDTLMSGYFLSDVGDMIRTYVCPVSEEATDFSTIVIRSEMVEAIKAGYYSAMENELSDFEKAHFYFSGEMMLYMQGLRFLTDYINNDRYYGSQYPGQNLNRAINQFTLLEKFQAAFPSNLVT